MKRLSNAVKPNTGIKVSRFLRGFLTFLLVLAVISIFFSTYVAWQEFTYAPLGDYPVQTVDNPRGADNTPQVKIGDVVLVTAIKCNNSNHTIVVEGVIRFERFDPQPEVHITLPPSSGERQPGCQTLHYRNTLPQDVTPGVWRIVGDETVQEGNLSQTQHWVTELFRVTP